MSDYDGVFETESLRAGAIAGFGTLPELPTEVTPIHRGNRKQTAIARFDSRGPVVVQVCAEQTWLQTEAALLRAIRERTFVPVPPVLSAGTHDGVAYLLTAYVAGKNLHERFASANPESQRTLVRWFGKALARLHDAFEFEGYGRLGLSNAAFNAECNDWKRWFHEFANRAIDRLPQPFDPIRSQLTALCDDRATGSTPPSLLFPWDFRPGNALVADGSVTAVLDWEAPLAAPPALSVAKAEYLVADWYVEDSKPLRQAFRDGYEEIKPFPTVRPAYRAAAIAESAVDSLGAVTNPRYPPVKRDEAIAFHLDALRRVVAESTE
jgi:aminoglycoside phosphotransferase (APT) family kinase protein